VRQKKVKKEKENWIMGTMRGVLLILVLLFVCAAGAQAEVFTFQQGIDGYEGGQDVTIYDEGVVVPLAGTLRIGIDYTTRLEIYNTLIRFENLEALEGLDIKSAELELTFGDIPFQQYMAAEVDTFTAGKMWHDPNANWQEANGGLPWEEEGAQGDTDRLTLHSTTNMGPRDFNTQYEDGQKFIYELNPNEVQAWIDDPSANTGILMAMHAGSRTWTLFYSNESTAAEGTYRPLLRVAATVPCPAIPGDINEDCYVNMLDLAQMKEEWLEEGNLPADLFVDEIVNMLDFEILARNWLECSEVSDPECEWTGP
jgi:dockerin type I repeat protein